MPYKAPYLRYREFGGFQPIPVSWTSRDRFTCLTGVYQNPGWSPNLGLAFAGEFRSIDDTVTPGFRSRSAKGEVIINPLRMIHEKQSCSGTFSRVRSVAPSCSSPTTFNEEDIEGPYSLMAFRSLSRLDFVDLITASEVNEAVSIAATRAWKDSAGHDADILQDVAEWHQTVNMFARPTQGLQGIMRAINSTRKGRGVAKLLGGSVRSAQDLWLQYRFGIRPLVSSVQGVVQALQNPKPKRRWTARGKYVLSRTDGVTTSGNTWSTTCSYRLSRQHTVTVRAGILLEEEVSLPRSLGIDASGMLALPWELVPYSFVADWFLNVGDFLYALSPYLTKSPLGSWWTVTHEYETQYNVLSTSATSPSSYTIVRPVTDSRQGNLSIKTRYLALPGPSVGIKPMSLGNVLADARKIDALALACQQIGKIFSH